MEEKSLYSQPVIDLLTVCAEFCRLVENPASSGRSAFTRTLRALLPMLYLKMTLLPEQGEPLAEPPRYVSEADYDYVRRSCAAVMADRDDYLDTFVEDFKYSEQPVLCTISENLADLYQALRDLLEAFRTEHEETMAAALAEAAAAFEDYWGQTLLNCLKAVHDARGAESGGPAL